MSKFEISDGDSYPTKVSVDSYGGTTYLELTSKHSGEIALLSKHQVLQTAAALYSAAGELVPEQKGPDGYFIRRVTGPDCAGTFKARPLSDERVYFKTLEEARKFASNAAAATKQSYTVYTITEIGTASPPVPVVPPVVWTEKHTAVVG